MRTIFIQMAAYRDPELRPTIADCLAKARYPEALRFGICWQRDEDESLDPYDRDPRFRVIDVDHRKSRGACWARNRIQTELYDGEDYTLQLDSHHRFAPGWDESLVEMLELSGAAKPLLTAYVPHYDPKNDHELPETPWKLAFDRFTPEGAVFFLPQYVDEYRDLTAPLPARFYSAHFAFASGEFCHEVKHDPEYYFHGEEISIAARAFTHGWDLFHPHRTVAWHEYTRQYRRKHWDDHNADAPVDKPWHVRNDESHARNRVLFGMEPGRVDFGPYGFGTSRTLAEYEAWSGLNFRLRLAHPDTVRNCPPPSLDVGWSDEEWLSACLSDYWTRITLPAELRSPDPDCDFWYVGVHDRGGIEIHREDLSPDQVAIVLAQAEPALAFRYRSIQRAHSWTVWPHGTKKGWLEKVTGPIGS